MTKHVRTALKMVGLKLSEVVITRTGTGHSHILVNGRTVVCSCTPRSPETASKLIARDLRRALS